MQTMVSLILSGSHSVLGNKLNQPQAARCLGGGKIVIISGKLQLSLSTQMRDGGYCILPLISRGIPCCPHMEKKGPSALQPFQNMMSCQKRTFSWILSHHSQRDPLCLFSSCG